jgi:hypothetical protein
MRKLLTTLAAAFMLAAGLSVPATAAPSAPAAQVSVVQAVQAAKAKPCKAHKKPKKSYWVCVTPGSYCPKIARKKRGYAYKTGRLYICSKYSNGQWRWKRA